MSLKMDCPHCKRALRVDEKAFGKTVACPGCGQPLAVPQRMEPLRTECSSPRRAPPENGAEPDLARDFVDRAFVPAPLENVAKPETPPVRPRTVAPPPPPVVPSPDRTIAAQLKIDALQRKATRASIRFFSTVAFLVLGVFCGSYNGTSDEGNHIWFVRVEDENPLNSIANPVTRDLMLGATRGMINAHHWEFSPQKFFGNPFAWLIMAGCISCMHDAAAYVKAANALKAASDQNPGTVC